jgi:succinate dehydrogenase / fumarate reductase flavoprotein subunit
MHGSNRLGGNSLSDLLVFGRRAGLHAAELARTERAVPPVDDAQLRAAEARLAAPFAHEGTEGIDENPYRVHTDLEDCMQELVGIIRTKDELEEAIVRIGRLRERASRVRVTGTRRYNPGWHLAMDLDSLLTVSETVARSALMRTESRGGHTREDYPKADPQWATKNVVTRKRDGRLELATEDLPELPPELKPLVADERAPAAPEPVTIERAKS